MHPTIKESLGYTTEDDEKEILASWKKRTKKLCKPCWELHYCPYGPLVEDFPLLPMLRQEVEEHNKYLSTCIETGVFGGDKPLPEGTRAWFVAQLSSYNENDYPEKMPKVLAEAACLVFGHICPVFFVAEALTETKEVRKHSRTIPRDIMLKVVRRDGQICQECNRTVKDNEVEFDHIIPYAKGGRSTAENLRVVHKTCNRKKSASLNDLIS